MLVKCIAFHSVMINTSYVPVSKICSSLLGSGCSTLVNCSNIFCFNEKYVIYCAICARTKYLTTKPQSLRQTFVFVFMYLIIWFFCLIFLDMSDRLYTAAVLFIVFLICRRCSTSVFKT